MALVTPMSTAITVFLIVLFTKPFICPCLCKCPLQESEALLSLNFDLTFVPNDPTTPWTKGTDCCNWGYVVCNQNSSHVESIYLESEQGDLDEKSGGVISDILCKLPFLTELSITKLGTTGTLPSCLGDLKFLEHIEIENNELSGEIPLSICMLTNLTYLSLQGNQLNGSLPFCLNNLSLLSFLSISNNQLSGQIPFTWGDFPLLEYMDVSFNQLSGSLPSSFAKLSSLTELHAEGNIFNESIPPNALPSSLFKFRLSLNHDLLNSETTISRALPSSIQTLYLLLNNEVTISETFFHNLPNLLHLCLSNCKVNISRSWIPSFQLSELELLSCQMVMDGSGIPPWISTQFFLYHLTLANNSLSGEIPSWLWDMTDLSYLNLSRNHLHGPVYPNGAFVDTRVCDLSNNALSGRIPSMWPRSSEMSPEDTFILKLNDNLFTGNILPSLCSTDEWLYINLENNKLDGMIPWCLLESRTGVLDLNLGGNSLEGRIPQGLTVSSSIMSLVLKKNKLSGPFLLSFGNDSGLQVLDIGHNKFTGHLPRSIVNLSSLQVLMMKDNLFSGNIPPDIGKLKNLQILDLSSNTLSGSIPHNIVFLQAMATARDEGYVLQTGLVQHDYVVNTSLGGVSMIPKGTELYYPYIWSTLIGIDLSNNQLSGDVPLDFGKLRGLKFLNLSMNNLSGIIPESLGNMSKLESLDLSSNKFSGNIPSELQSLNYLTTLNLSNNNLSGSIPQSGQMITFDNTSYSGNPYLQGCPLPKNCKSQKFAPPPPEHKDEEESEQIPWYQIGVGWSYGAGFLIVAVLLLSVSEKWRMKYFKGVDTILKFVFPFVGNRRL